MKNRRTALTVMVMLVGICSLAPCLTGCGDGEDEPASRQERRDEEGGGGPQGYGDIMTEGRRSAREEPAVGALRNELKQFNALKGEWPESLDEFKKWRGAPLPDLPKDREFDYDPETGELEIIDSEEE